jgi:hypothetical protein
VRTAGSPDDDQIDVYLDQLLAALRGTSRDIRRSLEECEAHLAQSVEQRITEGMTPADAAHRAISDFGTAAEVAKAFNRAHRPASLRKVAPLVAFQGWRLAAVGCIAIGISGLLSWALMMLAGPSAVFADVPGTHYDAASCAHFLQVQPSAKSCAAAALLEGRDDAIVQRAAIGVLGVLLLAASVWWRRRPARIRREPPVGLDASTALVAVTTFGAVGILLTGYGIDRAVMNTGSGQWIASGMVSVTVACGYLRFLWRRVTTY